MNSQVEKAGINGMPTEILGWVVKNFALRPHEAGYPVFAEVKRNKTNLVRLCRTSRGFRAAATPFLYETAILCRGRDLVLFLRSLAENPNLRPRVKHLACLINLKMSSETEGIEPSWEKLSPGITVSAPSDIHLFTLAGLAATSLPGRIFTDAPRPPGKSDVRNLGERIFASIVCLAVGLESVLFQMPLQIERQSSIRPGYVDKNRYVVASNIISKTLLDPEIGQTVLQKLTTVKIQPDMENPSAVFGEAGDLGIRYDACPGIFTAPNVAAVEAFKESGGWEALPRGVKDVALYGIIKPKTLGIICDYPKLERLTIQPAMDEMEEAVLADDVFNTALAKVAPTLRYLDFQTLGNITLSKSYGPTMRLGSLVRLTQLENLSIEIFALFGTSEKIDQLTLADIVPGSLKNLILTERWVRGDPILSTERDKLGLEGLFANVGVKLTLEWF
ncbi:hypothetical protein DL766_009446 [Monosporascus sp. MC13-8B]|nr:hypothetical protein DL766_009446 [Monosporascus sp. MC13-8B]